MGIEPESWNKDQGPFYAGGFNGMDDHQVMFRPPILLLVYFERNELAIECDFL